MDGILTAVKAAHTKAYAKGSSSHVVQSADLITVPRIRKAPQKQIAVMLEAVDGEVAEENNDTQPFEGIRQLIDILPAYGIDVCEVYVKLLQFENTASLLLLMVNHTHVHSVVRLWPSKFMKIGYDIELFATSNCKLE